MTDNSSHQSFSGQTRQIMTMIYRHLQLFCPTFPLTEWEGRHPGRRQHQLRSLSFNTQLVADLMQVQNLISVISSQHSTKKENSVDFSRWMILPCCMLIVVSDGASVGFCWAVFVSLRLGSVLFFSVFLSYMRFCLKCRSPCSARSVWTTDFMTPGSQPLTLGDMLPELWARPPVK